MRLLDLLCVHSGPKSPRDGGLATSKQQGSSGSNHTHLDLDELGASSVHSALIKYRRGVRASTYRRQLSDRSPSHQHNNETVNERSRTSPVQTNHAPAPLTSTQRSQRTALGISSTFPETLKPRPHTRSHVDPYRHRVRASAPEVQGEHLTPRRARAAAGARWSAASEPARVSTCRRSGLGCSYPVRLCRPLWGRGRLWCPYSGIEAQRLSSDL